MSDINPWKKKPVPSAQQVMDLTHTAIADWIQREPLPHVLTDKQGKSFELRQEELFYVQQCVRLILQTNTDKIDQFIKQTLGKE